MLAYSAGLRLSELINVKIKDIDSERMQIRIVQAELNMQYKLHYLQILLPQMPWLIMFILDHCIHILIIQMAKELCFVWRIKK